MLVNKDIKNKKNKKTPVITIALATLMSLSIFSPILQAIIGGK